MRIQTNFVRLLNLLIFHFLFYFTFFLSNILDCSPSPVGCTAMFIHGHGLSVPYASNIRTVANKIVSADTWTSPVGVSRKQAKAVGYVSVFFTQLFFFSLEQVLTSSPCTKHKLNRFHFRAPPVLATGPGTPNILDFSDMPKPTASAERENSARGKVRRIYPIILSHVLSPPLVC